MQRDQFEQFIHHNRDAFDGDVPELKVWGSIRQELDHRKQRRLVLWRVAGVAATVIGLLFCGAALGGYFSTTDPSAIVALDDVGARYAAQEAAYQEEIQQKYQQLASYEQVGAVHKDLERLDATIAELREELKTAPPSKAEDIVKHLLENYRVKVYILERVLNRIQMTNPDVEPAAPKKARTDDRII
jgi:HPt (histidine-containing phosphotransfer) domain-containing protein